MKEKDNVQSRAVTTVPMCWKRGDKRTLQSLQDKPVGPDDHGGTVYPEGTAVVITSPCVPCDFKGEDLGTPGELHPVGHPSHKMRFLSHEVARLHLIDNEKHGQAVAA